MNHIVAVCTPPLPTHTRHPKRVKFLLPPVRGPASGWPTARQAGFKGRRRATTIASPAACVELKVHRRGHHQCPWSHQGGWSRGRQRRRRHPPRGCRLKLRQHLEDHGVGSLVVVYVASRGGGGATGGSGAPDANRRTFIWAPLPCQARCWGPERVRLER